MEEDKKIVIEEESKLNSEANAIEKQSKSLTIKSEEDYVKATDILKDIKTKTKDIENFFSDIKANAHKTWKDICDKESNFKKPLANAEAIIKKLMVTYQQDQETIRKKLEQDELKRQAKKVEKLEKAGRLEEAELVANQSVQVVSNQAKVSGVSYQTDYVVTVIDEAKVPTNISGVIIRPVDLSAVKQLVKASKGKIQIDGIEVKETKIAKVRT